MWILFTWKPKCCNLLYSIRCSIVILVMGSTVRFISSVSYFVSSRPMTACSYTKRPGAAWSVMCCTDTTRFVEGVWIFLVAITMSISVLGSHHRRIFWVIGVLFPWPKQPKWTSWPSEFNFYTVHSRTQFWNSVWSLILSTILLVPADGIMEWCLEVFNDQCLPDTSINLRTMPFDAV